MATQSVSPNTAQFFTPSTQAPAPIVTPPTAPGYFSRVVGGVKTVLGTPMRWGTEEATQGIANRFTELFNANQPEFTDRIRAVFNNALLRRTPDTYHQLLRHIQAFLRNPSKVDLDCIKQLLNALSSDEIRSLVPEILPEGINALTTLRAFLDIHVVEVPSVIPTTVSPEAEGRLKVAEEILKTIIENHEGVLFQTMNALTLSMSASDGPVSALREQLTHPQNGLMAQCLGTLRGQLTSRANPLLREIKNLFDFYLSALNRNAGSGELIPVFQALQAKMGSLQSQKELVPQIRTDQWNLINQFHTALGGYIANPNALPLVAQLLQEAETIHRFITPAFNAQRGMIEEAADILVEGIGRGVEQLVPIPGRMLQGVLSPQPGAPASSVPPVAPTIPLPSVLNIGNVATQGQGLLSSLLASAGGTVAQLAANSLATLVRCTFEKLRDHVQENGENLHLLSTINPMIVRLQNPATQSSWGDLTGVLQEAFRFMQDQQVYLQGVRLPLNSVRNHTSAIPRFLNNINAHQNILQPPSHRNPQQVTAEMVEKQSISLKSRSSAYGPALFVAEKICGLEVSPAFYAEIFSASTDPLQTDLKPLFRQRLFDKIDASNINFIRKWFAKRMYDLAIPFSTFYVDSIVGNILKMATNWIKQSPTATVPKDEFLIKLIRNWMAVMSGTYNHVANSPASQSEDFGVMMEKALKLPERNGGLTQQQLYAAVAKTALDTFGPNIAWGETIDSYFNTEIPSDSHFFFLNPVVKALSTFCNYCLQAIVFVPQWIGNQVLKNGAKLAISYTPLLKDYSEKAIDSLRRNTPSSYAAQRMIYGQLQKVLIALQKNLSSDASIAGAVANRNTNIKTVEIEALVRYALEILNKGQYRTQDSLRDYLNHRDPLRNRAEHELENTFLPEAMGTAVKLISESLQTMTKPEEMQEMLHNGLQMANDMFNVAEPVSDEDFAAVEKGIRELNAQILETAIFHAIGEKFDFTNEKQKKGITQFITTLKDQTHNFSAELGQYSREIENSSATSDETLQAKITKMIEVSSKYNKERVDTQSMADGNQNFHTETKYHFNELSRHLATRCSPLAERLNTMKSQSDQMLFYDKLLAALLLCQQIHTSLETKCRGPQVSTDEITFCKIQLSLLKEHLLTLRRNRCPPALEQDIQRRCEEFSAGIDAIEAIQKADRILQEANTSLVALKGQKLAGLGAPQTAQLKDSERQLCELLNTLPFNDQKIQLTQEVRALMLATNTTEISSAAARFAATHYRICTRNASEMNTRLELFKRTREAFQDLLSRSIQEFSHQYVENKTSIRRHATEVATQVSEIENWAQNQHDLPIWNIFAFDMQWVTETITNIAFDRAKMKTQQLFDALYQKHNYIGFVNQVALLPFLENFGKHHLSE